MKKIHTRMKRKFRLGTSRKHYFTLHPLIAKPHRPKTYSSEEQANMAAKVEGINEYTLKPVKKNKRFEIVPKTQ